MHVQYYAVIDTSVFVMNDSSWSIDKPSHTHRNKKDRDGKKRTVRRDAIQSKDITTQTNHSKETERIVVGSRMRESAWKQMEGDRSNISALFELADICHLQ